MSKVCGKCKLLKPLDEYHKNATTKDGRQRYCKPCRTEASKQYEKNRRPIRMCRECHLKPCRRKSQTCSDECKHIREMRRNTPDPQMGIVYVLHAPSVQRLKIGRTVQTVEDRLKQYYTHSPVEITELWSHMGTSRDEAILRKRMYPWRITEERVGTEWYHATSSSLTMLADTVFQYGMGILSGAEPAAYMVKA